MRIPRGLLKSLAYSGLLFSPTIFGQSSSVSSTSDEVSSSHEDSIQSEADEVLEELGEYTRKKIGLKRLDKLLHCASALVEHQFNGKESALKGLDYMQTAITRMSAEDYRYKDLTKSCRQDLKAMRNGVKQNTVDQVSMTAKESTCYMAQVKQRYSDTPGLVKVAEQALNSAFECRKATGVDFKVGAILALGMGWDHYTCTSSLGRRYHYAGPTVGAGLGLGVTFDSNITDPTRFVLPLHSSRIRGENDTAMSWALAVGMGKTHDMNKEQKSMDFSVGAGYNNMKRGMFLMKAKRKPDFTTSGLYDHLGLPREIHL